MKNLTTSVFQKEGKMAIKKQKEILWEKVELERRKGFRFYLPKHDLKVSKALEKRAVLTRCEKPCSAKIVLFPKKAIEPSTGYGYYMINVDGYRMLNCFVISDPLNSTAMRGMTLELSFALEPFVIGIGYYGETTAFFDLDTYYDPGATEHGLIIAKTSDKLSTGGLPWIGGRWLSHILRAPVMGPYVRASVFNEDSTTRSAEVIAYATT
jgi:hypothetical protein